MKQEEAVMLSVGIDPAGKERPLTVLNGDVTWQMQNVF